MIKIVLGLGHGDTRMQTNKQTNKQNNETLLPHSDAPMTANKNNRNSDTPAPAVTERSNAPPVTLTQFGPTPATSPSTTLATLLPSASACPAANGSTYTATNKPLPTIAPELELLIPVSSLSFEILCNTNLAQDGHIIDILLITNVSTLDQCLDECALYSFRTPLPNFPAYACTAVAWGLESFPWPVCWLKSNATLGSYNSTGNATAFTSVDAGVLLDPDS